MTSKRVLMFVLSLTLLGCVSNDYRYTNYSPSNLIALNNRAVNAISAQLLNKHNSDFNSISPLVIATIVNIDNLGQGSLFGRLVTEQVAARFVQLNYNIVEINLNRATMVKSNLGRLVVTRDVQAVVDSVKAKAVVFGTYAENINDIYINLKVVNPENSVIIGAYSYTLPRAPNIEEMLNEHSVAY